MYDTTDKTTSIMVRSTRYSGVSPIDAIYLDFRKAFDTVPHQKLPMKLETYGIKTEDRESSGRHEVNSMVNVKMSTWADILTGIH